MKGNCGTASPGSAVRNFIRRLQEINRSRMTTVHISPWCTRKGMFWLAEKPRSSSDRAATPAGLSLVGENSRSRSSSFRGLGQDHCHRQGELFVSECRRLRYQSSEIDPTHLGRRERSEIPSRARTTSHIGVEKRRHIRSSVRNVIGFPASIFCQYRTEYPCDSMSSWL
jgi:hypothetical protein